MKTEQIGLGSSARNRRFRETKPISIRASTNKRDPGRQLCEVHNEIRRTRVTGEMRICILEPSLLDCLLARNYFNPGRNHRLNNAHGTDAL